VLTIRSNSNKAQSRFPREIIVYAMAAYDTEYSIMLVYGTKFGNQLVLAIYCTDSQNIPGSVVSSRAFKISV